jgi:DNA-binding transcriptional MerR regulator
VFTKKGAKGVDRMRTADVAREAGVSIYTVRFYQRRKLLPEPPRLSSNYRNYSKRAVELVRAIKGAQSLGFSLLEVQRMIQASRENSKAAKEIRAATTAKVRELDQKIRTLRASRNALVRILATCKCLKGRDVCVAVKKFRREGDVE